MAVSDFGQGGAVRAPKALPEVLAGLDLDQPRLHSRLDGEQVPGSADVSARCDKPPVVLEEGGGAPSLDDKLVAFNAPRAIDELGKHLRAFHDKYAVELDEDDLLAWQLAAGSWNAPAWADRYAAGQSLTQAQHDALWAYINRVTTYMQV